MTRENLRQIPGVDKLLLHKDVKNLISLYGREIVVYSVREVLKVIRHSALQGKQLPDERGIISKIEPKVLGIKAQGYKKVINATGIILHTNLGRAPLGKIIYDEISLLLSGYSNLEFDLKSGQRGKRSDTIIEKLKFITNCEDAVIVNNNAAALSLLLRTFAEKKEVIVSRGELIEIGGSFRLPEIIRASGVKMVEVGTTNRTRISDFENAITPKTKIILKAHRSNYTINGFTEDCSLKELSGLSRGKNILLVYDIGSGLLNNDCSPLLLNEPDVRSSLSEGADLITFSCDKLLGGPQAGIIAGKSELIKVLAKNPLMRTYRVDKYAIGVLSTVLEYYLSGEPVINNIPLFKMIKSSKKTLEERANRLARELIKYNIDAVVVKSKAQCGGGTLPDKELESYSVKLLAQKTRKDFSKKLYIKLLSCSTPVVSIVREGSVFLDVLTVMDDEIDLTVQSLCEVL